MKEQDKVTFGIFGCCFAVVVCLLIFFLIVGEREGITVIGWCLGLLVVCAILYLIVCALEKMGEKIIETPLRKKLELAEEAYNLQYDRFIRKYGIPTRTICGSQFDLYSEVNVFEKTNRVWVFGHDLSMDSIIGCDYFDSAVTEKGKTAYNTHTNSGSMLGRALVGGVLLGGAGAVIGGATANKTTTAIQGNDIVHHNYTVVINVDDLQQSVIMMNLGNRIDIVNEVVGLMNVIIRRNQAKISQK